MNGECLVGVTTERPFDPDELTRREVFVRRTSASARIGADREGRRREEETAANASAQSVYQMSARSSVPGMRARAS